MNIDDDWEAKADEAEAMRPANLKTETVLGTLEIGLKRSWPYGGRPVDGSWIAILEAPPLKEVWSCSHGHTTNSGAWVCGYQAIRLISEGKDPNGYQWNAVDDED